MKVVFPQHEMLHFFCENLSNMNNKISDCYEYGAGSFRRTTDIDRRTEKDERVYSNGGHCCTTHDIALVALPYEH